MVQTDWKLYHTVLPFRIQPVEWIMRNSRVYRALNSFLIPFASEKSKEWFYRNERQCLNAFLSLHKRVRKSGSRIMIVVHSPFFEKNWEEQEKAIALQKHSELGKKFGEITGTPVLQMMEKYRKSNLKPRQLGYDMIHPNLRGHLLIAEAIEEFLKSSNLLPKQTQAESFR